LTRSIGKRWKKRPKRPQATSIALQPFPNKEAALAGRISSAKSRAAGYARTLKSLDVEKIYIGARDAQVTLRRYDRASRELEQTGLGSSAIRGAMTHWSGIHGSGIHP